MAGFLFLEEALATEGVEELEEADEEVECFLSCLANFCSDIIEDT